MNGKINICTGLLFSSLALSAGPAGAVSPHSSWFANKTNSGATSVNMAASAGHFCYLSSVGFENTDESGETATCSVTRGAVVWGTRSAPEREQRRRRLLSRLLLQ